MAYRYEYSPRADRQLARLPQREQERVLCRVKQLSEDPGGRLAKQLRGRPVRWTSRIGNLRVLYEIDEAAQLIYIEAIGNRSNVYDLMRRLR